MMNRFDPNFVKESYVCDSSKPVRLHFIRVNSSVAFVVILYIGFCGHNIAVCGLLCLYIFS